MDTQVLYPYINTKFKNFIEIPARGLNWLLNKLKLRELFKKSRSIIEGLNHESSIIAIY